MSNNLKSQVCEFLSKNTQAKNLLFLIQSFSKEKDHYIICEDSILNQFFKLKTVDSTFVRNKIIYHNKMASVLYIKIGLNSFGEIYINIITSEWTHFRNEEIYYFDNCDHYMIFLIKDNNHIKKQSYSVECS